MAAVKRPFLLRNTAADNNLDDLQTPSVHKGHEESIIREIVLAISEIMI